MQKKLKKSDRPGWRGRTGGDELRFWAKNEGEPIIFAKFPGFFLKMSFFVLTGLYQ
jgi:hypothetical protein